MKTEILLATAILAGNATPAFADDPDARWFVRPYVGLSQMSDLSADFTDIDSLSGDADIDLDGGFAGGLGVGYRYTDRFAVEVGWEYRSNDSEVLLADTSEFDDGNYASNIFYLNGHYLFERSGQWQPYVGAGLTWVEEVDIDLERGGNELSYSGDGDTGYQVFAGVTYDWSDRWQLQTELRYGSISGIELSGEGNDAGEFDDLDYETTTLQIGLVYNY